jgi:replicative DNA helicase
MTTTGLAIEAGGRARPDDRKQLAHLFQALPPHAMEAESSLLGSMLWDHHVVGDVIQVLKSGGDFFKPAHSVLYDTIVEIYDQHASLDIVQLNQRLVDKGVLDAIGGLDYLVQLAQSVPSAANAMQYARIVREKAIVRELIEAAGEILQDAHQSSEEAKMILERAEQRIFHIAQRRETVSAESLQRLIEEELKKLEANEGCHITGVATGFRDLDEMTSGLQKGELIVLAARPSMGKTALALNVAEQMALGGAPVGVFSLEMSREQLVQRLISAASGVDLSRLRRGMIGRDNYPRLLSACGQLQHAPLFIDDTPGLTLLQLRAKARRMASRHNIKAIVIDYLQLMAVGGRVESRQMEVSEMSRGVKAMARELEVPVICLSQLNRAAEQREGHRPRMSDLRESGSIEQDADVIVLLHREEYYHRATPGWVEENPDKVGVAELIIAKQRNGPTGTVELVWDSASTRFRDRAYGVSPGYGGSASYNDAPRSEPSSFAAGRRSGPAADHRDGGGPDRGVDDDDLPV